MHPILGDRLRLRLHLVGWSLAGGVVALLVRVLMDAPWPAALAFGVPLGLVAAPVSLSAWYLCRAMPLSRTDEARIGGTALGAAIVTASLWAGLARVWWRLLGRTFDLAQDRAVELFTLMLGLGVLGYLLSVTVHYVLQATEDSAIAARRALESQIAHRDAELRALRAQVDPHFLFNSLNSVVGLISVDPDQARVMCLRLAEFLRDSLTLGSEARIPLGREAALAEQYLGIERVRFGPRLTVTVRIAPEAVAVDVPPLIVQPLVENAVRHGVATLVEGGDVRLDASVAGPRAVIEISNPYDPDVRRRGTGFGLDIVRRRLAAAFGEDAALTVEAREGRYRATITLPVEREDS